MKVSTRIQLLLSAPEWWRGILLAQMRIKALLTIYRSVTIRVTMMTKKVIRRDAAPSFVTALTQLYVLQVQLEDKLTQTRLDGLSTKQLLDLYAATSRCSKDLCNYLQMLQTSIQMLQRSKHKEVG